MQVADTQTTNQRPIAPGNVEVLGSWLWVTKNEYAIHSIDVDTECSGVRVGIECLNERVTISLTREEAAAVAEHIMQLLNQG